MHTVDVRAAGRSDAGKRHYRPPQEAATNDLLSLMTMAGCELRDEGQLDLLRNRSDRHVSIYCAGDLSLLKQTAVSIVGTREVSSEGWKRAGRLARELAQHGIIVTSGLAKGVDTAALTGAIEAGGRVIAVIGTPLQKAYPAENAALQQTIYEKHLLISPFAKGETVFRSNFPKRNRVMALLTAATVIVEASDTSGTLHQAAECVRQGRWLFILASVVNDERLTWPKKFLGKPRVSVLQSTEDVLQAIVG